LSFSYRTITQPIKHGGDGLEGHNERAIGIGALILPVPKRWWEKVTQRFVWPWYEYGEVVINTPNLIAGKYRVNKNQNISRGSSTSHSGGRKIEPLENREWRNTHLDSLHLLPTSTLEKRPNALHWTIYINEETHLCISLSAFTITPLTTSMTKMTLSKNARNLMQIWIQVQYVTIIILTRISIWWKEAIAQRKFNTINISKL